MIRRNRILIRFFTKVTGNKNFHPFDTSRFAADS